MSVGIELEWSDVDRHTTIPEHLGKWSTEDYSIVNSDGHANCPDGTTWRWGGEINTRPTKTAHDQAAITAKLVKLLRPTMNYKNNLHVHIGASFLLDDLPLLKLVAFRMRAAESFVYSVIEPLEKPTPEEYPDYEEWKGAVKRWRRNLQSHQHSLSDERFDELMAATTVQEVKDAHAAPTSSGGRAWHIAKRPGMNLRSLWKHGTIEFRHFPGTIDPVEVESACSWCLEFFHDYVLGEATLEEIYGRRTWYFPKFRRYDHKLQLGFEATKFKK